MATYIQLKHTPIKEIILTISFKENLESDRLDTFRSLPAIKERFPYFSQGFSTQLQTQRDTPPTAKVQEDGYILRNGNPHSILLQARRGSLSFHKVNGYEHFDNLINEFQTYWKLLEGTCGLLTVNQLNVRYLNFIEIIDGENINDFIKIILQHPFTTYTQEQQLAHLRFTDVNDPTIGITVVSATGKSENRNGLVLDIILNKNMVSEEVDGFNFASFNAMRRIKNDVFFQIITEKTINKYS